MRRTLDTGCVVLLGLMLAAPATAQGPDAQAFEELLGQSLAFEDYPKPWPLENLVTAGKLTVGTTGTAPPRTFVDPAKLDWPGILPGLAANRFDMACDGASWSAQRIASQDFLMTSPTAVNATVGLARKDAEVTSWEDAAGRRLGGVRGEIYFEDAKAALTSAEAVEFPGMTESMLGLQNRQVDLIALNLSNALEILTSSPMRDQLVMVGPPLRVFPQGLCVNANAPDLLEAVNLLLGNYRADGTLLEIVGAFSSSTAEVEMLRAIGY
jgi:ABC-type amino acid transport substrate-binding protein